MTYYENFVFLEWPKVCSLADWTNGACCWSLDKIQGEAARALVCCSPVLSRSVQLLFPVSAAGSVIDPWSSRSPDFWVFRLEKGQSGQQEGLRSPGTAKEWFCTILSLHETLQHGCWRKVDQSGNFVLRSEATTWTFHGRVVQNFNNSSRYHRTWLQLLYLLQKGEPDVCNLAVKLSRRVICYASSRLNICKAVEQESLSILKVGLQLLQIWHLPFSILEGRSMLQTIF